MTNGEKLPLFTKSNGSDYTVRKFEYPYNCQVKDEMKIKQINDEKSAENEGVSIAWKDLKVIAEIKKQHLFRNETLSYKKIIHDVNGYVGPSSLVAILGASGSGKTTFMSGLANRQSGGLKVVGDIRLNGKKLQQKFMKEISGFVYQDELFIPSLTLLEHLHFAARLKLDKNLTSEHREKMIEKLIRDVGLTKCARNFISNTRYGEEKMILSGGERKRLSVATELLTNPPLLFCDEPTTGLDSYTSLKLTRTMRKMTFRRATTIICSIHQPNEQILNLFHQIILLHEGRIAFSGTAKDAVEFFQSLGYNYQKEQNPGNYLIECLAVVPGREPETSTRASNICTEFQKSHYAQVINDRIKSERYKIDQDFHFTKKNESISWFYKLYLLAYREILVNKRNPTIQRIELIKRLVLASIVGICMMGSITMTQKGIQSLKGALYFILIENLMSTTYHAIAFFSNKMPVFCRECTNNVNTPMLFYLSNFISMIPLLLVCPILYVSLIYIWVGLRKSWLVFWWTIIFTVLVNFTSAAFGILLSISTNTIDTASIIFNIITEIFLICCGILINLKSISWTLSWIRNTSWITYAMEVLLALQLDGVKDIECSKDLNMPCFKTGQQVLESLDFNANNLTKNLSMICIIFSTLFVLGYLILEIKVYFKIKR